jgi:molybdopterin/thiamine biosynthesis adenylyltransferase
MKDNQLLRYSRHILLPEIEYSGQEKLLNSHCLVIGAGGLGSPVSIYLASSGIGKITICDFDDVDISNLQRQILHSDESVGTNKALSARKFLNKVNPEIIITPIEKRLNIEQMTDIAKEVDVIIDCSDNFETRYALNKIAFCLKKPLVSGAAIKFDGQISVFDFGETSSPCYECLFPDTNTEEELRCADHGVFSPMVGIIGATQAAEAIKIILGVGISLMGRLLLLDSKDMTWKTIKIVKDKGCKVCSI